jgi:hypothetical protein
MQHPDEGTIHAWLDAALAPNDAAAIDSHVRDCAVCAARVAEARGLIAATSHILTALDDVPAGVLPERTIDGAAPGAALAALRTRHARDARRNAEGRWLRGGTLAAAGIVFVAIASVAILRQGAGSANEAARSVALKVDTATIGARSVVPAAPVAPTPSESGVRKAAAAGEAKRNVGELAAGGLRTPRMVDSIPATGGARPVTDSAIGAHRAVAGRRDEPVQLQTQEQVQAKQRAQRLSSPAPAPASIPVADSLARQRPVAPAVTQSSARDVAADFAKTTSPARNAAFLAGCYEFDRDVARGMSLPERIALDSTVASSVSGRGDSVWFRARALDRDTAFVAVELLWVPGTASAIRGSYDAEIMLRRDGTTSLARVALEAANRAIAPASPSGQVIRAGGAGGITGVVGARRIGCPR